MKNLFNAQASRPIASLAILSGLAFACGPSEQAKTVTNSDTTTTSATGTTETKTQDTKVLSSDGSKQSTHNEQVNEQPKKQP